MAACENPCTLGSTHANLFKIDFQGENFFNRASRAMTPLKRQEGAGIDLNFETYLNNA